MKKLLRRKKLKRGYQYVHFYNNECAGKGDNGVCNC